MLSTSLEPPEILDAANFHLAKKEGGGGREAPLAIVTVEKKKS